MFWPQGSERPNPPTHAYGFRGGEHGSNWGPEKVSNRHRTFFNSENWGKTLETFDRSAQKGLTPPPTPVSTGGGAGRLLASQRRLQRAKIKSKIWKIEGNPWQNFGRLVMGGVDTCLVYPQPSTRLDFLLHHPLPRKASCQGGGSHRGKGGRSYFHPWPRDLQP